jgi:hypothetical protein
MSTTHRHASTNTGVSWGSASPISAVTDLQNPDDHSALRTHNVDHNSPGWRRWIMLHGWAFWKVKRKKRSSHHFSPQPHSTLHTPHPTPHNPHLHIHHSILHNPRSTLHNSQHIAHTAQFPFPPDYLTTSHNPRSATNHPDSLHSTVHTQYSSATANNLQFTVHSHTLLHSTHFTATRHHTPHSPLHTCAPECFLDSVGQWRGDRLGGGGDGCGMGGRSNGQ